MFDEFGQSQRQGCAVFNNSFISQATGVPSSEKRNFINRGRFWCAIHELGHCLNLAHAWQKSLDKGWRVLANEDYLYSFMNYPYNHPLGEDHFWANFVFTFSRSELLFIRHAPREFVQPGNRNWFVDHALKKSNHTEPSTVPRKVTHDLSELSNTLRLASSQLVLASRSRTLSKHETDLLHRFESTLVQLNKASHALNKSSVQLDEKEKFDNLVSALELFEELPEAENEVKQHVEKFLTFTAISDHSSEQGAIVVGDAIINSTISVAKALKIKHLVTISEGAWKAAKAIRKVKGNLHKLSGPVEELTELLLGIEEVKKNSF